MNCLFTVFNIKDQPFMTKMPTATNLVSCVLIKFEGFF